MDEDEFKYKKTVVNNNSNYEDHSDDDDEDKNKISIIDENQLLCDKIHNLWTDIHNYISDRPLALLQYDSFDDFHEFYLNVTGENYK